MNVLFINDSTTYPNWGGRAATVSLRMMIRQLGGNIVKSISIDDLERSSLDHRVASKATGKRSARETVGLFIPPVLPKLRRRLMPGVDRAAESQFIPRTWGDYDRCVERVLGKETPWPELLRSLGDIDVAVVFGDGDIYGNNLLPRTLLFLSLLVKQHFGKPVVMVNHSADLDDPDLRRVAEVVYPLFDDVVFRDQVSAERCKTVCAGRFAADTAFWFKPALLETWAPLAARPTYFDVWPDTASFDPSSPYLCVGGSSLFDKADIGTVVNGYDRLVRHLGSVYSGQIVMTVSDGVDDPVLRPIAERFALPLIGVTTPVQQAVDILGNADAYIGGRWHPSIFALRGGTPIIALSSKTFKMRALMDMAGLPPRTFDAVDLQNETDAIGQLLSVYVEQGADLRRRLCSWADEMAENSWDNVAYLHGLAARPRVPIS
jgi:polysaccharide pyruvyl transferase WcaK-like protein